MRSAALTRIQQTLLQLHGTTWRAVSTHSKKTFPVPQTTHQIAGLLSNSMRLNAPSIHISRFSNLTEAPKTNADSDMETSLNDLQSTEGGPTESTGTSEKKKDANSIKSQSADISSSTGNQLTGRDLAFVEETDEASDVLYRFVDVEVRGHDKAVLSSYDTFLRTAAEHLEITIWKEENPRSVYNRWVVLKSAHVHKKHRVQYEARTHFRSYKLCNMTGSTADTFLEYIQRNLPEGVAMKVTRHRIEELPPNFKQVLKAHAKEA